MIYKVLKADRYTDEETTVARCRVDSYDEAIEWAEKLEVFPDEGIFGSDNIEPNRPEIILVLQEVA